MADTKVDQTVGQRVVMKAVKMALLKAEKRVDRKAYETAEHLAAKWVVCWGVKMAL